MKNYGDGRIEYHKILAINILSQIKKRRKVMHPPPYISRDALSHNSTCTVDDTDFHPSKEKVTVRLCVRERVGRGRDIKT